MTPQIDRIVVVLRQSNTIVKTITIAIEILRGLRSKHIVILPASSSTVIEISRSSTNFHLSSLKRLEAYCDSIIVAIYM